MRSCQRPHVSSETLHVRMSSVPPMFSVVNCATAIWLEPIQHSDELATANREEPCQPPTALRALPLTSSVTPRPALRRPGPRRGLPDLNCGVAAAAKNQLQQRRDRDGRRRAGLDARGAVLIRYTPEGERFAQYVRLWANAVRRIGYDTPPES